MWFYESQNKMQPLFLIYIQWYAVKVLFGFLNVCANEFYHNLNPNLTPGDIVFDNTKTLFFSLYSRRRLHIWSVTTPHCSFQVQYLTCYHTRHIQKGNINTQHSKSWIIPLRCIFSYICCLSVIIHIFLHFSFHLLMWVLMVFFFSLIVPILLSVYPSVFVCMKLWRSADGERETAEGSVNDRTLSQHAQHFCLKTTNTTQKKEPLTQCTNLFHCYTVYGPKQTSML